MKIYRKPKLNTYNEKYLQTTAQCQYTGSVTINFSQTISMIDKSTQQIEICHLKNNNKQNIVTLA